MLKHKAITTVLILVLLEYVRILPMCSASERDESLNPCFVGICKDTLVEEIGYTNGGATS